MTFTWLNKQGVRSDAGFEFQRTSRFAAEYRENGLTTEIYVEGGAGVITIYDGSLISLLEGIENPFERKAERDRLIKNLRDALAFQGLGLDLVVGSVPNF
jgi:hypothetical protein